jgi:hypothetical protein
MITLRMILLLLALVTLLLASLQVPVPRVNLTALGLFFFVLASITG